MQVSASPGPNPSTSSSSSSSNETPADAGDKKTKHATKSNLTHKSKEHAKKDAEKAAGGSESSETKAAETKTAEKPAPKPAAKAEAKPVAKETEAQEPSPDVQVILSPKGKAASQGERETKQVGVLLDHIESGNLSKDEHDMAMSRVGEILKKYGKA